MQVELLAIWPLKFFANKFTHIRLIFMLLELSHISLCLERYLLIYFRDHFTEIIETKLEMR